MRVKPSGEFRYVSRIVFDDEAQTVESETWTGTGWVQTDEPMKRLVDGDPTVDEISEADARTLVPNAFR